MKNNRTDLEFSNLEQEKLDPKVREHITFTAKNQALQEFSHPGEIRRKDNFENSIISLENYLPFSLQESERTTRIDKIATKILHCLAPHRRLLRQNGTCADMLYDKYISLHLPKAAHFVAANKPIHFILPAFPAKSPNTKTKVLGKIPDMAEEQALLYLQRVCDEIETCYLPGARITICSDGRVFSDLVHVDDDDVTIYGKMITKMIDDLSLKSIDTFNMEDLFSGISFDEMRLRVHTHYAEPLDELREKICNQPELSSMYNGIHRFLIEDALILDESKKSKNKIKKECSRRAYSVIQRSNAWTRLIGQCFPKTLRLSIHPQRPDSEKIGILLGDAQDCWMTPWHSVAVKEGGGFRFMKRIEAEGLGAKLIERDGCPSYYEMN